MHARPQIREHLLAAKMKRWAMIARCPLIDPSCPPARARRNFWRLCASHPDIMAKLQMNMLSVFDPL